MSTKHTPEPWTFIWGNTIYYTEQSVNIGRFVKNDGVGFHHKVACTVNAYTFYNVTIEEANANAQRIIACVNACAGMDDPELHIQNLQEAIDIWEAKYNDASIKLDECEAKLKAYQNRTIWQRIKAVFVK